MSSLNELERPAIMSLALAGAAFLGAGAAKIASHVWLQDSLISFICGTGSLSLQSSAHCWGCPAAFAGLSLIAAAGLLTQLSTQSGNAHQLAAA